MTTAMTDEEASTNGHKVPAELESGSLSEDDSCILVDWSSPDDPANPMNWSSKQKWTTIGLVSFNTFNVSMASTIFAPGVPQVLEDFHSTNSALSSFMVSVYIIGFAIGPLVLSPTSEIYGRLPITHVSNIVFVIASILCAVSVDMPMLIVFRLVMGLSGCVPVTLGGGFIADMMPVEERGSALMIWVIGPLLGPVIGPVVGGYMALGAGWRWTFWLVAILGFVSTVACFLFIRETYAPTLLQRKASQLHKQTGRMTKTKFDKGQSVAQLITAAIARPTKMLIRSPIVMILSLYVSVVYSYMYLLFTTFTTVFEDLYGFNSGEAGLAYLGLGVGFCIGQFTVGPFSDWHIKRQKAIHGSIQPEVRLPPLVVGSCLVPIGLFWYGWSAKALTHWMVPIVGTGFVGVGILYVFMPIQMYLIDTFGIYAASAIAANTVVRSVFGATIPLAGTALYDRLGLGWGNSLLGFIAIVFAPVSLVLIKFGSAIRTHPKFQPNL